MNTARPVGSYTSGFDRRSRTARTQQSHQDLERFRGQVADMANQLRRKNMRGSYNGGGSAYVLNSVPQAHRMPPMGTTPYKGPGEYRGNWEAHNGRVPVQYQRGSPRGIRTPGMRSQPDSRIMQSAGRRGMPRGSYKYMNYQKPSPMDASAAPFVPGATTKEAPYTRKYNSRSTRSSTWDICWDFKKGNCKRESRCKWRHVIEVVADKCQVVAGDKKPAKPAAAPKEPEPEDEPDNRDLTPEDESEPSEEIAE